MTSPDRARLTIDLDALAFNYGVMRREAEGAEVAAVVKADGYGLGAALVSRRLWAEGCRSFFVARLGEGEDLRAAMGGRDAAIYVLDGLLPAAAPRLAAARLVPVLSTAAQVADAAGFAGPVALQIDSGMNRQGLTPDEAARLAGRVRPSLVMSHLGSATNPDEARSPQQLARFQAALAAFPDVSVSLAASAGLFLGRAYRFDMVRAGVSLFGGGPEERPDPRLRAVVTLTAPILDVRRLAPGDRVGYGASFTAERAMRVAVVGAGYADGVVRAAMGKGHAWAAGAPRRLLAVNMDLLVIEFDDGEPRVGDHVELLGANAAVDDLAQAAGTVAHEVLVRLSRRAERIHLGEV